MVKTTCVFALCFQGTVSQHPELLGLPSQELPRRRCLCLTTGQPCARVVNALPFFVLQKASLTTSCIAVCAFLRDADVRQL